MGFLVGLTPSLGMTFKQQRNISKTQDRILFAKNGIVGKMKRFLADHSLTRNDKPGGEVHRYLFSAHFRFSFTQRQNFSRKDPYNRL